MIREDEDTYNDRTLAAVVGVLLRWTSLTATLPAFASEQTVGFPSASLGRQSQTLPQLPNPILYRSD